MVGWLVGAMILRQVLREIESARGPVNLTDLSRKLGVERSALEGMIAFWARKGRLRGDVQAVAASMADCSPGVCDASCPGPRKCSRAVKAPRTHSFAGHDAE